MAVQYDSVVTGKGNPWSDIEAVQQAVDQGGSVLLKGTFVFGRAGKVIISKDVNIYGETDAQGIPVTKIRGGLWTFQTKLPEQLPPPSPGPKIGIQGIHFERAQWSPIFLPFCSGATIINNKITEVRPITTSLFGKEGMFMHGGITLAPVFALPNDQQRYQPGAITGTITIADNDIDLSTGFPEKTMAQGVFIMGTTGAKTQILRNRITNCSRNSVETFDNYPGDDGSGMTIIKGNRIVTANKGIPLPGPDTPNGIIAGWFLDMTGATDPARFTKIVATENKIETRGDTSGGISILSDGAVITSNHILLKGGSSSKGIFVCTSDSLIANNKIEGSGGSAIMVRYFQKFMPRRNVITGNDLTSLQASIADVFLSGSNNMVLNQKGNIVDKGQANLIME